ncbi:hypothetical protein [Priestia megaterium]|uniref:hypothetical protein n=1 Tax=Priestia megaterium TaxID=1404 RepID=UPI000BFCA9B1|nr:hypothetical protein [Priestia megaterium]PGT73598.1 hypothetical protein COD15_10345 [Priestia megaterium]
MLKSLVESRKKLLKFLTIFSPAITIFLVYFLKINFALFIAQFSTSLSAELQSKPTLAFTINSAFVVIVISSLIEWLKYPGEFVVELKNNSRKADSYFDIRSNHRPTTIHMDCKFNFKNKFFRWLVKKLGGLTLNCEIPSWLDYTIENKKDLKGKIISESKEEFELDINQALQKKTIESPLYVKLSLLSKSFDINYGTINPSIEINSKNKINRIVLYIIIWFFFDIKTSNYKVEARNDIF